MSSGSLVAARLAGTVGAAALAAGPFSATAAEAEPAEAEHRLHRRRRPRLEGRRLPRLRHQDAEHRQARRRRAHGSSQFYVQPMCTPTRAALMTGRYPLRYGLQTAVIPSGAGLRAGDRRVAAAAGAQGGRLRDGDHRQVAPRPRRPASTGRGSAASTTSTAPLIGEIDYFTHEAHGVLDWFRNNKPVEEKGYPRRSARQRRGEAASARTIRPSAALPLPRLQRAAHAVSGAEGIPRPLRRHRRPDAPRLRGAWSPPGRRDRPGGRGAGQEGDARQHADRLPQRQRRHAQRDVRRRERHVEDQDARRQRPVPRRQGNALRRRHARRRARQLARPHQAGHRRRDDPRRRHVSDARRARRAHRPASASRSTA